MIEARIEVVGNRNLVATRISDSPYAPCKNEPVSLLLVHLAFVGLFGQLDGSAHFVEGIHHQFVARLRKLRVPLNNLVEKLPRGERRLSEVPIIEEPSDFWRQRRMNVST